MRNFDAILLDTEANISCKSELTTEPYIKLVIISVSPNINNDLILLIIIN